MSKFYDLFPRIQYDIAGDGTNKIDTIVDISLRLGVVSDIKNNSMSYYEYIIREGDTPENLADRVYGSAEYHWIILLMNDIINPLFDWPLSSDAFNQYITNSYGSIATAKTRVHHYEKIIKRTDRNTSNYNQIILEIDETTYNDLPEYSLETETLNSGKSIDVEISTQIIYCYDWENDRNEEKRTIKLVKKEYIPQILGEFAALLSRAGVKQTETIRTVR